MTKIENLKYQNYFTSGDRENVITLFTPTFNRSVFLNRVYNCLLNQSDKRFVWIVVDDGSNDNTVDVATEILKRNEIPMLFISKSNRGKHRAFETAFNECHSEFFMCMDDDDIYSPESIATYLSEWQRIKSEGKYKSIGAIRTITQEENGRIVSAKSFDKSLLGSSVDQTTLESNYIKHEFFENWTCYRTAALQSIELFPKNYWMCDQHKFFSEGIWQGRFARKYVCRYLFVVLREYRHDTEVSIIRSNKSRQHYLDMFINAKMTMDEQLDYIAKSFYQFIRMIALVCILRHKLGLPLKELLRHTTSSKLRFYYTLFSPLGFFLIKPKVPKN